MDPVEINAGAWYLRALRADDRVSDVPALADLDIADPAAYVHATDAAWAGGSAYIWAVCEPTTGELIAVIGVEPDGSSAHLRGRARQSYGEALDAAAGPVSRFAAGALGLDVDGPLHDAVPPLPG